MTRSMQKLKNIQNRVTLSFKPKTLFLLILSFLIMRDLMGMATQMDFLETISRFLQGLSLLQILWTLWALTGATEKLCRGAYVFQKS